MKTKKYYQLKTLNSIFSLFVSILVNLVLIVYSSILLGTHSDLEGARNSEEIERYFKPLMNGRKWCVSCCSAYDRTQIIAALETLIDLMVMNV